MKTLLLVAAALCGISAQAQSLSFTSGVVTDYTNITLNISGPSNLVCQVERLNIYTQQWDLQGYVPLSNGLGSFSSTMDLSYYGFFRCRGTNWSYLSTNAFAAVSGYVPNGYSILGNPFAAMSITNIMPTASTNTLVYQFNNATTNYTTSKYMAGRWFLPVTVNQLEAVMVSNPGYQFRYIVSGLIPTNSISKNIPSGLSLQCSPIYQMMDPYTGQVDLLTTNLFGGNSSLPVRSVGFSNECNLLFLTNSYAWEYQTYALSNSTWNTYGWPTSVPLKFMEGFWVQKPTNAVWNTRFRVW